MLLLGFALITILNSCSKDATIDVVNPASVEVSSTLKEWATKNDKLSQANLIEWNNSTQITLSDSIKGYSAPVKTGSGFKEFITFELDGKRHGWYKSYKLLSDTKMEIIIKSIEGQTLQAGILHKMKIGPPKGKSISMKEMNLTNSFWSYLLGTLLVDVTVTAPRLYLPDDYIYQGTYLFEFKAFYDSEAFLSGSGGTGAPNVYFEDYNTSQIDNQLTDPCFIAILNDLRANKINNKVGDIVSKFVTNPSSKITFNQEFEVTKKDGTQLYSSFNPNTNEITLSESRLKNASIEFIAITIIHELFHAKIGSTEQIDHTRILNEYVVPMGVYMYELYGMNSKTAENLLIAGLRGANGFIYSYFENQRYTQIDDDIYNYANNKISGNHCK